MAEHQIVDLDVVGSSPIWRPSFVGSRSNFFTNMIWRSEPENGCKVHVWAA